MKFEVCYSQHGDSVGSTVSDIGQQGENEPPKFPLFDPNGGRGLGLLSTGAGFWLSQQHVAGRGPVSEAAARGFSLSLG